MKNFKINLTRNLIVLVLCLVMFTINTPGSHAANKKTSTAGKLQPIGATEYRVVLEEGGNMSTIKFHARRKLAPFQLCLACKCCATTSGGASDPATTCSTMPCCFAIDCALPNKPYGVCAFVPKTCNCTSCAA